MKTGGIAIVIGLMAITAGCMDKKKEILSSEGFIGRSEIVIEDGHMSPEALLAFGRLSDPQVSPDGRYILYGVSYTSVEDNRSVRNLYICNMDGSGNQMLTTSGKSISNARWSADGKHVAFLTGGQIHTASVSCKDGIWKMKGVRKVSDVPSGIGEFKLSPDQSKVMYISYIKSHVDKPSDRYGDLDKATAYVSDDLMYRHWDHTVLEIPHTFIADFGFEGAEVTAESSVDILAATLPAFENPLQGIMNFLLLSAFTVAELACFFIALIDLFKGVLVNDCLVNPRYQAILCFDVSGVYEMRDDALHRLAIPRHILPCFRILDVGAFFVI